MKPVIASVHNLPPVLLWASAAGAIIAGGPVVYELVRGRFFPWRVRTVAGPRSEKSATAAIPASGDPERVYLQIKAWPRGGLTVSEVTAALVTGAQTLPGTRRAFPLRRWLHWHKGPPVAVAITSITSTAFDEFGADCVKQGVFATPYPLPDRWGLAAELAAPYFRGKGAAWYLTVAVRATEPWAGYIRIRLPSRDAHAYYYLPLTVTPC